MHTEEERSENVSTSIESCISNCLLKKLAKNYDESSHHPEYDLRMKQLSSNIIKLRESLKTSVIEQNIDILSSLLILFLELKSKGDWNLEESSQHLKNLESDFALKYKTDLFSFLQSNSRTQDVLDLCLEKLHAKLTLNDLKKYPSMIEVYHELLMALKEFKVHVSPQKGLPASLHLVNDYIPENKIKGLNCCQAILMQSTKKYFEQGNYYEVLYETIKKTIGNKNFEITKLGCSSLLMLVKVLPSDIQKEKCEEFYSAVIEEILMESNFYRKRILFEGLQKIISFHGANSAAKKRKFLQAINDNFNNCKVKDVKDVIFHSTLQCLEEWIRYGWCTWCYQKDYKLLSSLFLILYLLEETERKYIEQVQNIIITLIGLSLPEQQDQAIKQMSECKFENKEYLERVKYILTQVELN